MSILRIPGFAFSFGVFQDYYSTHEPFARKGKIAIIGTTATVRGYIISISQFWTHNRLGDYLHFCSNRLWLAFIFSPFEALGLPIWPDNHVLVNQSKFFL